MAEPSLLQLSLRGQKWPNVPGKTLWPDDQDQGGDITVPGVGTSHKDTRFPCCNIQAGISLPLPAPQWLHPNDKWLSHSLGDLHLNPQPQESWSRVWRGDTPTYTEGWPYPLQEPMEECSPEDWTKKQVRFNVDEDLDNDPTLAMDLTTFQEGNTAEEWDNAPIPSIPLSVDPPQLPCSGGHQCHPTHTGEACLKVPVPSAAAGSWSLSWIKGMPDLFYCPNQWVKAEMDRLGRHSHWWKEIWAIQKYTLGRYAMWDDQCTWGLVLFSVAGCRLQAASHTTGGMGIGGVLHPVFVGCVLKISCPMLMPPERGTSRLWGRRRPQP